MSEYVRGPTYARNTHPTVRTKPSSVLGDRWTSDDERVPRRDSGGGYVRVRSNEYRDHTATQGSESVYVYLHRLCAVAWCYPDDMDVSEILEHMDGRDVHHTTGVEWANFGESPNFEKDGLEVRGHGDHSRITQAQMRAWASDAKESAQRGVSPVADGGGVCGECGTSEGAMATTDDLEGEFCLECVTELASPGDPIRVL